MQVELNIGLERKDGVLPLATYRKALAILRTAVALTYDRTYCDDTEVKELGLFVAFDWMASAQELITFIGLLSIDLGQDRIAVYCVDKDRGVLVGPKADQWGEFDKAYFKRFDVDGNAIRKEVPKVANKQHTT